jgi:hypothetical protein
MIEQLLQAPSIHVDETSLRVDQKNHWIHVYSSGDITLKFCHRKRGREAIEAIGIIPLYGGPIMDHQLAQTAQTGIMLAGYLIEFEDFVMQTGGSVSVTREILQADEVVRVIDQIEDDQLATSLNNPSQVAKLARDIVSATIRLGHVRHVSRTAV